MPEMSVLLPLVGLLMVIGAFAGVLAGLLGVGGGIVLVPAFFYAFFVVVDAVVLLGVGFAIVSNQR